MHLYMLHSWQIIDGCLFETARASKATKGFPFRSRPKVFCCSSRKCEGCICSRFCVCLISFLQTFMLRMPSGDCYICFLTTPFSILSLSLKLHHFISDFLPWFCGQIWSCCVKYNDYNDYNGGWPLARLFGWSAADWSRPATNKSISSEREKSLVFCWKRKPWTSWLLTCCSKKGWAAEKSSKKMKTERKNVSSQLKNSKVLAK